MKKLFVTSFLLPFLTFGEQINSHEDVNVKLNVLEHTLSDLVDFVNIQKKRNEDLELRILQNQKEFEQMKDQYSGTIKSLETRILKLEDITKTQVRDVTTLRKNTVGEKRFVTHLKRQISNVEKVHVPLFENPCDPENSSHVNVRSGKALLMGNINPKRLQSKRHLRKRYVTQRSNETGIVAFYAYMSSVIMNPSTRLVLVFDVVRTNIGNAYHASTGVFIVPESGVYVFTWTFRSGNGDGHSVQLMINTVEYGSVYHRTLTAVEAEETGIVVAQVTTGDDVYVRIKSIHHIGVIHYIQSDSDGRTSFAGWKL